MPKKIDVYRTYGQKLIKLFVTLLFTGQKYSLTELSQMLGCSKQTVLRLLNDIQRGYLIDIKEEYEQKKKYVSLKKPSLTAPVIPLTENDIQILQMCRAFTEHLLGKTLFEEATNALLKGQAHLPSIGSLSGRHFASFRPGSIDYTHHHDIVHSLMGAMEKSRICQVTYQGIMEDKPKQFFIKPLKLFSHHETVYLHAQKARTPGKEYHEPDYDPLLAIHRIKDIKVTERLFKQPRNYDFEKFFNKNFGIRKEDAFEVEIEFKGWAARFAAERICSPDQKIKELGDNKIRLIFTASSEPDVISWLLYFGEEAKLINPDWLVEAAARKVQSMAALYNARQSVW
jgi:predicted DNA-binding transcriptional regulator YafY